MSQAQVQRFFKDIETQNALYWRREHFLWELLSHATSGTILEGVEALGPTATAYQRVKKIFKAYRALANEKKRDLDQSWDDPSGKCFAMAPGLDISTYCDRVDEMAASIVRLSSQSERSAAVHRTSDGEKHRKVLNAWKLLVDSSTSNNLPRHAPMSTVYILYDNSSAQQSWSALKETLVKNSQLFSASTADTTQTAATSVPTDRGKPGEKRKRVENKICYDCGKEGVTRFQEHSCPSKDSLRFAPEWYKPRTKPKTKVRFDKSKSRNDRGKGKGQNKLSLF